MAEQKPLFSIKIYQFGEESIEVDQGKWNGFDPQWNHIWKFNLWKEEKNGLIFLGFLLHGMILWIDIFNWIIDQVDV